MHLLLKEAGTDATGTGSCTRSYERHWTPVHLDFDVDDVDAAVVEVKRLGGTVEGLKRGEWGAAAFCADCAIAAVAQAAARLRVRITITSADRRDMGVS